MFLKIFFISMIASKHIFAQDVTHRYKVNADAFKKSMSDQMQKSLCREDQNFMTCYQLSVLQCKKDVEILLMNCFNQSLKSSNINLATESDQVVQDASICLGKSFHKKNQKKFLKHKSCREIE